MEFWTYNGVFAQAFLKGLQVNQPHSAS